jgi:hypothetical protein
MIQAIAIDDEPLALKVIEGHASKINFLNLVKRFTDPAQGKEDCNSEPPPKLESSNKLVLSRIWPIS